MNLLMKHPETGEYSSTLTIAVAGFTFAMIFSTAALVAAWITNNPNYLSNIAMIDASILTPSLAAYTTRRWSDQAYSNNNKQETLITPDTVLPNNQTK